MVKPGSTRSMVRKIMMEFARRTGLSPARQVPRRYLWTDAFAVCNFLELFRQTGDEEYRDLALRLGAQVHGTLGRYREDDSRTGWLSGLEEEEGQRHPTIGGLRIGKSRNERKPGDPFDENLEWDRDGQYYHYLTKWMHALNRLARVTGDPIYHTWAIELAKTAHARFTYIPRGGGQRQMYWKMRVDLSSPLVPSMGHHDPLDGFITYHELQAAAAENAEGSTGLDLHGEIAAMAGICKGRDWATEDSLGIGGLLSGAYTVAQLIMRGPFGRIELLENLLDSSRPGLESFTRKNFWRVRADSRLAFRELGLSIGLHAIERLRGLMEENPGVFDEKLPLHPKIERMMGYTPLSEIIEGFWLEEANQKAESWTAHQDINTVMLATSLAPDGYLSI